MQACTGGARFLVSPGMTPELAAAALATERPYLPGIATPSEVITARGLGISFLKLFPAEAVSGSWMAPREAVAAGDWATVRLLAERAAAIAGQP